MTGAFKWPSPVRHCHKRQSNLTTRVTTATRAGCGQRGLGRETPGAMHGSSDPRPSILQLNTEGSPQTRSALLSS